MQLAQLQQSKRQFTVAQGRDTINLTGAGALYVSGDAANDNISIGTGANGNNTVTGGFRCRLCHPYRHWQKQQLLAMVAMTPFLAEAPGQTQLLVVMEMTPSILTAAGKVSITGGTGTDTITLAGSANVTVNGNAGTGHHHSWYW